MDTINRTWPTANGTLPDPTNPIVLRQRSDLAINLIACSLRKIALGKDRNSLLDLSLKHETPSLAHADA